MRVAALLLLVAVVAFFVGRLTAPEGRGRGGQRGPPTVVVDSKEAAPPASRAETAPIPSEGVVQPTEPMEHADESDEPGDELGVIAVDFTGFEGELEAWVGSRTMRGGYDEYSLSPAQGETSAEYGLVPGIYDVWWQDREGRRGTRAAVEAGKRTLVRASEIGTTPPIPEGLGILDLEVEATWGGGLSCVVVVKGRGEEDAIGTNMLGRGSATLFPGRYVLEIGHHREEVQVVEGRAITHRIVHGAHGDLLLDTGNEILDGLALARPGGPLESTCFWTGFVDGVYRCGFVFVREGEYDVSYVASSMDTLGVPLGRAVVHAGRTTSLRCRLPPGGLKLRVIVPKSTPSQVAVVVRRTEGNEAGQMNLWQDIVGSESRFTAVLAPGRYSVTATAGGCEAERADIEVGDRMVDLALELVRAQ